jgi:hypothetical protein
MLFFLEAKKTQHLEKIDAVENRVMPQHILGENI